MGDKMNSDNVGRIRSVNISGHGNVIGNNSSSWVNVHVTAPQQEALAVLDEFIRKLDLYEKSISDVHRVRQGALAARTEIAEPLPKWERIRSLLRGVAASVAGVAALSDLVNNALSIVAHL
jgi:hypothetical protein